MGTAPAWEKPKVDNAPVPNNNQLRFLVAGSLLLGAIAYLILSGPLTDEPYFLTVDEIIKDPAYFEQAMVTAFLGELQHNAALVAFGMVTISTLVPLDAPVNTVQMSAVLDPLLEGDTP